MGFEPTTAPPVQAPETLHATQGNPESQQFTIGDDGEDDAVDAPNGAPDAPYKDHEDSPWKRHDEDDDDNDGGSPYRAMYGSMNERSVWGR